MKEANEAIFNFRYLSRNEAVDFQNLATRNKEWHRGKWAAY